jgi:hypothetical protein
MFLNEVGSTTQGRLGSVVMKRMETVPLPLKLYMGPVALVVLAVLLAGLGGALATSESPAAGIVCAILAVSCVVSGVLLLVRRAALRCALTVHEHGVVVSRKGADEVIPYNQVRDFSLQETDKLYNGTPAGVLRTLVFTHAGGKSRVSHFSATDTQDTFGPILAELLKKLADAAQARLETGATLEGKGWRLDSHGLQVGGEAPVPLRELAGVGMFEDKVSFWRPGEELPFFSVPGASPNARLLGVVSERHLSGRERPMAGPLGRILFQRQMSTTSQVLCWVMAGLLFFFGGVGAFVLGLAENWLGCFAALGICWGMAVLFAAAVFTRLRVHELGVTQRVRFGNRTLRYSEVTSFQFGTTRHYHNGVYTGTSLSMRFKPGPGLKAINHSQTVQGSDADLETLREHVSMMVATQLLARLEQGEEIHWGPRARFTKNGLVVQASKLFGKGEERLAPYGAGLRYQIEEGTFHLFIGAETKAAMSVECSADNFYPGLNMLGVLCSRGANAPRIAG